MLKRFPCDVLILLDCCYAASAAREESDGINELLAACGREVLAEAVTDRSFTRNLMFILSTFRSEPFTVSELYERLLRDKKRLSNTPIYFPLSGRKNGSIRIAPLMPTALAASTPSEAHSPMTDLSLGSTSSLPSSLPSSPPGETSLRVLLAVSLKEDSSVPNLEEWTEWLRSEAPDDIQRINVKIEAAFSGNSTLMLVSIPISIWIHLPDTSTYRFVGFIKSDNFMNSKKTATATSHKTLYTKDIHGSHPD
jgi:hypothetical protein